MALKSMVPIYFSNICSSIFHTLKMCMELTLSGSHPWLFVRPTCRVWETIDQILPLPCPQHPLDELPLEGEGGWAPLLLKSSLEESYGRKAMTNLDRVLKSRDITLLTKVLIVKAMVFPVVMYGHESWTIKKAECWRIDAFELWCWKRLLRVSWIARRSNQSILKKSTLNIHWKDWC